jgi:4'-phosphopantetheinyl transferase
METRTPRLSSAEIDRAVALSDGRLRREWLASHIALRLLIERAAGVDWRKRVFARTQRGKPSLEGAPIDFSLSHAPGVAMIAISHNGGIGVDVERPRRLRLDPARRERIEDAATAIAGVELPRSGEDRTLQAWVRLEALAKADGCGMGRLLTRLGVIGVPPAARDAPLSIPADLLPPHRGGTAERLLIDVDLGSGFFAAVAVAGGQNPAPARWLPVRPEDLLAGNA